MITALHKSQLDRNAETVAEHVRKHGKISHEQIRKLCFVQNRESQNRIINRVLYRWPDEFIKSNGLRHIPQPSAEDDKARRAAMMAGVAF